MVPQQLEPLVTADYAAWCVCMLTTFWGRDAQLRPPGKESKSCSPCLTFVNGKMVTSCNTDGLKLFQQTYVEKIHPMTIPRSHGPDVELTSKEITALRGLCGALQWPSVQSSPHLQASVSLAAGQVNSAR